MYTGMLMDFLGMGGPEVMLIMVVILLLFGGKKLPELARGLGKGLRDFKDASEGVKREIHRNINSVGIVDEVNDMVSNINDNSRHHPSEASLEEQMYPGYSDHDKGAENLEGADAHNDNTDNTKIETDKTKL